MFHSTKKKSMLSNQSVTVHLLDAHKRSKPLPFTLNSTDLTGLLIEAIQLGKLLATEERDLEAIRSDYTLKSQMLMAQHNQIITEITAYYDERTNLIAKINQIADACMAAGQYEMAEGLLNKLIVMVSDNSPLRVAMDLRDQKLLT